VAPGIFPPVGGVRFLVGTYLPNGVVAPEPTPRCTSRMATDPVGLTTAFTDRHDGFRDRYLRQHCSPARRWRGGGAVSGDVLIENGTRHRFRVVGDMPAVMASFLIGARPR